MGVEARPNGQVVGCGRGRGPRRWVVGGGCDGGRSSATEINKSTRSKRGGFCFGSVQDKNEFGIQHTAKQGDTGSHAERAHRGGEGGDRGRGRGQRGRAWERMMRRAELELCEGTLAHSGCYHHSGADCQSLALPASRVLAACREFPFLIDKPNSPNSNLLLWLAGAIDRNTLSHLARPPLLFFAAFFSFHSDSRQF